MRTADVDALFGVDGDLKSEIVDRSRKFAWFERIDYRFGRENRETRTVRGWGRRCCVCVVHFPGTGVPIHGRGGGVFCAH